MRGRSFPKYWSSSGASSTASAHRGEPNEAGSRRAGARVTFMQIPSLAILGPSVARQRGLLPTPAQRLVNGDQARGCLRPALCEAVLGRELRSLGIQNLEEIDVAAFVACP